MPTTKKTTTKAVKKATRKTTRKSTTKVAKKPAKKTAPKRSSVRAAAGGKKVNGQAKKATSKKSTGKVRALVCAEGEECFWTSDGQVLESLDQLAIAFGSMNDDVFLHHVTKEKNDFADWVEGVLNDTDCAVALRRTRKPRSARTVVVRCLKTYKI